mgnify:CR=1 FL=1
MEEEIVKDAKTILIVDDEQPIVDILVYNLKKEGYIQNLTDTQINQSQDLDLYRLHRCYPLNDSIYKMMAKIIYRSIRY